jgi:hemolysin activation/secretion protein
LPKGAPRRLAIHRLIWALGLGVTPGHAQPLPPTAADIAQQQRRQIEREQQERQRLEAQPDVRIPRMASAGPSIIPVGESPCFRVERIELVGPDAKRFGWITDSLAGTAKTDSPLFSISGKCLGAQGVGIVLKRAQDALIARGFVTSRVLAEPQDLSSGSLRLTLVGGRIRRVAFTELVDPRGRLWNAVPAKAGDLLNIRDIEQALENFKRVPTADADIQIAPALHPDESDLLIRYRQGFPLRGSVSIDDSGTKATGKYQGGFSLSYDNLLTLNDLFYATFNRDLGGGDGGSRGSHGNIAHYSVPMGYWMLGATLSSNRYFQTVAGASQDYVYSGTNRNAEVKLSRVVYRDASRKTTASIKAFQRRSNNFIDDTEVQVQRRIVGGWEAGVTHKEFIGAATLEGGVAYKRGTGAFGALPAPEEAFGEGSSRFALAIADAGLSLPFKWAGQPLRYNASVRIQRNKTPLTPQDRFAIGGRYTVRGFDGEASLSAERGWLLRNDLSASIASPDQEAYIGIDHGEVGGPASALLVGTRLTGAVLGWRGGVRGFQYDFFIGAPLRKPEFFRTASTVAGMSLNYSF